jgi:hypothetical protein
MRLLLVPGCGQATTENKKKKSTAVSFPKLLPAHKSCKLRAAIEMPAIARRLGCMCCSDPWADGRRERRVGVCYTPLVDYLQSLFHGTTAMSQWLGAYCFWVPHPCQWMPGGFAASRLACAGYEQYSAICFSTAPEDMPLR